MLFCSRFITQLREIKFSSLQKAPRRHREIVLNIKTRKTSSPLCICIDLHDGVWKRVRTWKCYAKNSSLKRISFHHRIKYTFTLSRSAQWWPIVNIEPSERKGKKWERKKSNLQPIVCYKKNFMVFQHLTSEYVGPQQEDWEQKRKTIFLEEKNQNEMKEN